jgi:hypothetical protein
MVFLRSGLRGLDSHIFLKLIILTDTKEKER